ncbi:uncharacterized protein HD556DRAFT_425909 [Suillus plorans]|uniref:Uncharacterized protein n=1 Tax=Suillus plorans TaxID=116603 RepID=A0A9P7DHB5_9AGAM|nr:uncharacterized protein HD556DRAFT_425909 [Suillus plorans]KAG1794342.1 hypothetical protein HD556DRAFT_425909 [Suillus plorans]
MPMPTSCSELLAYPCHVPSSASTMALLSIGFNRWIRKLRFRLPSESVSSGLLIGAHYSVCRFGVSSDVEAIAHCRVLNIQHCSRNILSCTPPDACLPVCHSPECHMYLTSLIQTFSCTRRRKIPDCIGIKFLECFHLYFVRTKCRLEVISFCTDLDVGRCDIKVANDPWRRAYVVFQTLNANRT